MTSVEIPTASAAPSRQSRKRRVERQISADPVVGKDILELLSSAMYVDPRAIFREYIQNAADSIDDAFERHLFGNGDLARVDVTLDSSTRSIVIRDNGSGIAARDAERILTAFGASQKRGKKVRGFRGVGRLAAFGYAQTVTFRTKAAGDSVTTEIEWDCRRLRSAMTDPAYGGDLRQLVRDAVTVISEETDEKSRHFFEVRLERVVRIKNDLLLNPEEVRSYLGEVAPVPFAAEFARGVEIDARLNSHVPLARFQLFLNGSLDPIVRPHADVFPVTQKKVDSAGEVQWFQLPDGDGGLRAIVWVLHHSYLGALHGTNPLRGLRARVRGIQVGDDKIFADVFPEPRFNSWTIGEVEILDDRIVPNGRRDGFEQSAAFSDLIAQLVPVGREVTRRCRQTSAQRARVRGFLARADRLQALLHILTQRGITKTRESRTRAEIGRLLADMKKILKSPQLSELESARLKRRLAKLQRQYDGIEILVGDDDPLNAIAPAQRGIYRHVLDLIFECSPNKTVARSLADRITSRLAAQAVHARRRRAR